MATPCICGSVAVGHAVCGWPDCCGGDPRGCWQPRGRAGGPIGEPPHQGSGASRPHAATLHAAQTATLLARLNTAIERLASIPVTATLEYEAASDARMQIAAARDGLLSVLVGDMAIQAPRDMARAA